MIAPGQILGGRYRLLTPIATGGMGEVWKARDTSTGTLVAAKVLRPELTGEEISLSRLRLEAKNAMLSRHPNIAAVLDSGQQDGQGWIVMELVDGRPMSDLMGDGRRMSAEELIPIMVQTAYALDGAARAGVVHRDIKPANILIRPDGLVKLTDFGVSLGDDQVNLTAAGMVMGTAQYLAPEQALGDKATSVGDLYSLGIVAYEALAGERPFTGKSQVDIAFAHVNQEARPLPSDVPPALAEVVAALMQKDPAKRPQTGAALGRELVRVAAELGVETTPRALRAAPRAATATPPVQHTPAKYLPVKQPEPGFTQPASFAPVTSDSERPEWRPVGTGRPADSPPDTQSASKAGLWVIIALIFLTIALIVVAMVRNANDSATAMGAPVEEVAAWLTPTVVA